MRRRVFCVLAAMALCLSASAGTYEVVIKDVLGSAFDFALAGWEYKGITFVTDMGANEAGTKPAYYPSKGEVRLYPDNTLTIRYDKEITSVRFALSEAGVERLPEVAVSCGEIAEPAANPLCWEGCAREVTFTVGLLATYGTIAYPDQASGQLDFTRITIVTEGEGSDSDTGQGGSGSGEGGSGSGEGASGSGEGGSGSGEGGSGSGDSSYNGVEDVVGDFQGANAQYYTLQGVPMAAPIPGHPCIALINGKAHKILYMK